MHCLLQSPPSLIVSTSRIALIYIVNSFSCTENILISLETNHCSETPGMVTRRLEVDLKTTDQWSKRFAEDPEDMQSRHLEAEGRTRVTSDEVTSSCALHLRR